MHWTWRLALLLLGGVGVVAFVACGLELAGVVAEGTLVRDGSHAERWVALVVGGALQPFVWSTWIHAKLTRDASALTCLRFGVVSRSERIPLADVKRWGSGEETNRGRRHLMLLLERHDRTRRSLKLEMFARQQEFLRRLEALLGPPARTENTMVGVTSSED